MSVEILDQDIQCLLCDRVIAECRSGKVYFNPHYGRDAQAALTSRRCAHCGGRLVGFQVVTHWADGGPLTTPPRRRSRAS